MFWSGGGGDPHPMKEGGAVAHAVCLLGDACDGRRCPLSGQRGPPRRPRQRWRQLRFDEETHAIRLSDEDGMVEILGGVLEAGADIFSFQIRVVSKNLIL